MTHKHGVCAAIIIIGAPGVHRCSRPAEPGMDGYCFEHANEWKRRFAMNTTSSLCCVFGCSVPVVSGSRTCASHAPRFENGEVAELRTEVARLKELLRLDETGLSAAIGMILIVLRSYSWILAEDEWGSYDENHRTQQTLRQEIGYCLTAIEDIAKKALTRSGKRADAGFKLCSPPNEDPIVPVTESECRAENANLRARIAMFADRLETIVDRMKAP